MFLKETDVCNFADDNTLFSCSTSLETVITSLEIDVKNCLDWFQYNQLVANPDKFQLMFLGINNEKLNLTINNNVIKSSNCIKLLGIYIDNKLKFDENVENICKK